MRKQVKILAVILLCVALGFAMTGCVFGTSGQEIHILVYNTLPEQLSGVIAAYSLDEETTTPLETVESSEAGVTEFVLRGDDIEKKSQLKDVGIHFSVQETDGTVIEVATVRMAVQLGKTYQFKTSYADGIYGIWQITD